mmetsp:Transcript_32098/g.96421  ORF Transcript_32098/g.96421 Transcript_32098/m.96421 type:complete len:493 (-) Transcript_32098:69-1547(-)
MLRFVSLSILLGTAAASAAGVDTCAPNACQPAASFLTGVPGASPEIVVSTAGFEAAGLTLDVVAMSAEATRGAEVGTRVRYSADGLRGANDEPPCPFVAVLPTEVSASERSQDRRGTTVSYGRRVVAAAGPSADGADRAEVSLAATCFDDRVALAAATTRKTPSTRKTPCASEIWDYYGECVPETCETWHDGCNECFIHVEEGDMTCTHNHCKVPVHEPMCLEERRPGPQPTSKDCASDLHDEYGVCIPASCAVWHDGCNRCTIVGEFLSCTEKWCDPKMTKDGFCATKKDAGFDESPAPPPPNDPHCAARDAYWRCVPPGCAMYYDGCNRCAVHGNTLACTKMMCSGTPQATQVGCLVYQGDEDPAAAFHVTAEDESPDAWSASGVAALAVRQGVRAIGVVLGLLSAASTEVDVCAACAAVEDGVVHVVLVHADDVVATVSGATITCADAATGAPAPCLRPAAGACRAISAWETGCGHGRLLAGDADQVSP